MSLRAVVVWAVWVLALSGSGCDRTPSNVRDWRPSDHDHTDEPNAGQTGPTPTPAASAAAMQGINEVAVVAWKQNCVTCHGIIGAGDGPQGPMVKATNLSNPVWQEQTSDEQIASAIRRGKGSMPAFSLPDSTIASLVRLVRLLSAAPSGNPETPEAGTEDAGPLESPAKSSQGRAERDR